MSGYWALHCFSGLVQTVACAVRSSQQCHSVTKTAMELIGSCGDPKGRGVMNTWDDFTL
jgi:hypothetical protein